jgi:hypothetical protein
MYVQRSALALLLALTLPVACSKSSTSDGAGTAASESPKSADDDKSKGDKATASTKATEVAPPADTSNEVIQDAPFGSVGWLLENDGAVKADVRDKAGAPIADDFVGTLATGEGNDRKVVSLAPLDGSTLFGGALPSFTADLTAVTYAMKQGADVFNGTFYVPAGGSSVLTDKPAEAPAPPGAAVAPAATAVTVPAGGAQAAMAPNALGPNGGVVQMIGDQRVELVSDQATGEVRAYLLDAANKVMPMGDRKITLGVVADHPELVSLQPAEGGNYAVASWGIKIDPLSLTVAVRDGKKVHAGLFGWRPGARITATPPQPIRVAGKRAWQAPKKPLERGRVIEEHRAELDAKVKLDGEARAKRRKEHPEERRVIGARFKDGKEGKDLKDLKDGKEGKRDGDDKRPRGDEAKDPKDLKDLKDLKDMKGPKDGKHDGDDKRPRKGDRKDDDGAKGKDQK